LGRAANVLIFVSRFTAASFDVRKASAESVVIYNPVPLSESGAAVTSGNQRLREPSAPAILSHIAQIAPWKGQEVSIRALALLRRRDLDVQLWIAGEVKDTDRGSAVINRAYYRSLKDLVHELDLADSVVFLGEVKDVPELLAQSDLLLLPSTEEPFGRVVVEAMAAGCPVIATAVGGPSEVITHGVDGWLLLPADVELWAEQIRGILADPGALRRVSCVARERVAGRFTVEAHVRRVREHYAALL
jgi:glycosyltransferase involved in cell wall biosynthesis